MNILIVSFYTFLVVDPNSRFPEDSLFSLVLQFGDPALQAGPVGAQGHRLPHVIPGLFTSSG
jgi:hypothetical protein